jgi:hypothetical protein
MPSLNEVKYAALYPLVGVKGDNLNQLEHKWLVAQGATPGPLGSMWYQLFARSGVKWNDAAHIWLTGQGAPPGKLNERWYWYWDSLAPVQIVFPDMILTAGDSGGSRVGYNDGSYGDITPDTTTRGDLMTALFCNNSNGRVRFQVQGEYAPDAFTSIEIVGVGTLLAADAVYDYDGTETEYRWNSTGFTLTSGDVYAVEWT